mgnify:CR=1 FL=1|jgi:hypothetical protein
MTPETEVTVQQIDAAHHLYLVVQAIVEGNEQLGRSVGTIYGSEMRHLKEALKTCQDVWQW